METNCELFYLARDVHDCSDMQQIIERAPVSITFKRDGPPPCIIVKRPPLSSPSTLELKVDGGFHGFHDAIHSQRVFELRVSEDNAKITEPHFGSEGYSGPIKIEYHHQGELYTLLAEP